MARPKVEVNGAWLLALVGMFLVLGGCWREPSIGGYVGELLYTHKMSEADALVRASLGPDAFRKAELRYDYARASLTPSGRRLVLTYLDHMRFAAAPASTLRPIMPGVSIEHAWRFYAGDRPVGPWFFLPAIPPSVPQRPSVIAVWTKEGRLEREWYVTNVVHLLETRRGLFEQLTEFDPPDEEKVPEKVWDFCPDGRAVQLIRAEERRRSRASGTGPEDGTED